ncbi:hypothetical protein BB558_007396 [Smittium angustum]|uniref:AWS domain-containing protein n=1 Tax=Smittium angustum TaxID=133377 RepID=A0A2U1IV50_SMIAN|nr:hypothetical protein BB558_007396 [Smittium angustum]
MIRSNNEKLPKLKLNDRVKVQIPSEDRGRISDKFLLGVVKEISNDLCLISTKYGTLNRKIHRKHILLLNSNETFETLDEKISLTSAFRKASGWNLKTETKCSCTSGCQINKCKCTKAKIKCQFIATPTMTIFAKTVITK